MERGNKKQEDNLLFLKTSEEQLSKKLRRLTSVLAKEKGLLDQQIDLLKAKKALILECNQNLKLAKDDNLSITQISCEADRAIMRERNLNSSGISNVLDASQSPGFEPSFGSDSQDYEFQVTPSIR